jgi:hypothetical protein
MKTNLIAFLAACFAAAPPIAAAERPAKVYVALWFDTEDYILPASDDAALKVAEWLTKEGIRATFKVVGEKARTLEQRKRQDVIDSLKKHEIGYHSNFHSVQPTPAMYLSALGWDEGVAEFDRREKSGFDDVKRIFGQMPTCYGQPGSSWGPQSYGALRKWGVPLYLDYGRHVGMKRRPMYFDGILNIYDHEHTLRSDLDPAALPKAKDRFVEVHKQLVGEGGGLVSIYYHPCEFVHKQFWDGANFNKGANPPRGKWIRPEAKTTEETKAAYDTFFEYIRFIQRFAEVKFVTASELTALYKDGTKDRTFEAKEIGELAKRSLERLDCVNCEGGYLSPAELLELHGKYLHNLTETPKGDKFRLTILPLKHTSPFGPSEATRPMAAKVTTDASQFLRTNRDVADYLAKHNRVPSTVWLGSSAVTPEAFLHALAKVIVEVSAGKPVPEHIELAHQPLETEKHVHPENPKLWGWTIFPEGFNAPEMMKLAKRQAWTIKPAILRSSLAIK